MRLAPLDPNSSAELAAVLDLFEIVYGRALPAEFYRRRFIDNPFGAPLVELLWDGDVLAGHYAASPMRSYWNGEVRTAQSMTTMTNPAYRNQGIFTKLAESLFARMAASGVRAVWGFPNSQSHYGFVQKLGWHDVGVISTFTLDLTTAQPGATAVVEVDAFPPIIDELARAMTGGRFAPNLRDTRFVAWRYPKAKDAKGAHGTYRFFASSASDSFAVVKPYALRDGRKALEVLDTFVAGRGAANALFASLARVAHEEGAALLRTWIDVRDPRFPELEKLGFVPREPLAYFGARFFSADVPHPSLGAWHLTMGDSDNY